MRIPDTMQHPRFRLMTSVSVMTLVLSMTFVATAAAQNARSRANPATFQYRDLTKELANTMTGNLTVAAVGDLLIQEPIGKMMSPEIQAILRGATTAVGNMQATIIDVRDWPYGRTGNYSPLTTAQDIADLGFDKLTGAGCGSV